MPHSQRAFSNTNLLFLAFTYLCYFGQLGVFIPYLGVFLDGRGFSSAEIGQLSGLITLARIIGPNLWASLADKSGKGLNVLQLGALLTLCSFCSLYLFDSFWGLTLGFALTMMFWSAILPQIEVLTLSCVLGSNSRYGRIRLWGSIGYIVLTITTGLMIDLFSSEAPIVISTMVLLSLFIASLLLSEPHTKHEEEKAISSVWDKVKTPLFLTFIFSAMLLQLSFGAYYGFFALYTRDLGYSGQATGWLIALGVMVEIAIFMVAGSLIKKYGVKWMLIFSMGLTSLRWILLAQFADYIGVLILSQTLHAFSFGMTHSASIYFIHHYFGKKYQSRGQAIYISIAFGIGGAAGSFLAGHFWQQGMGAQVTFQLAALSALAGALILLPISSRSMLYKP